jgi:hypothetical protein
LPEDLHQRYALVVDAGTIEHCFNIGQAAMNIANLAAVGGFVMHANPLNMFNHGFYNLNPTWYSHFYAGNGFTLELAVLVNGPLAKPEIIDVPLDKRFLHPRDNTVQVMVARRRKAAPMAWPTQAKYRANPTQKQ